MKAMLYGLAATAYLALNVATASAQTDDDLWDTAQQVADEAGVDPIDLLGAMYTTGLEPRTYLCLADHLLCPKPAPVTYSPRVDCIIAHESQGDPRAVNRRSGAAGLGQFLGSTWMTTPQGRAGLSVFDPSANRAAVAYMLAAGRAREFQVVSMGYC